jgi:hypothetical protein
MAAVAERKRSGIPGFVRKRMKVPIPVLDVEEN